MDKLDLICHVMSNKRTVLAMRNLLLAALVALGGCATPSVDPMQQVPPGDPSPSQVRHDIDRFVGKKVRWGGVVIGVENHANYTSIEILARSLDDYGRPQPSGEALGRFIAHLPGFLDPAVHAAGREITVIGVVEDKETRPVGEYPYPYILIRGETAKLWPRRIDVPYYPDPYYDPFYDPFLLRPFNPWYPWYPPYPFYPYWR